MYAYIPGPLCPFCGRETTIMIVPAHGHPLSSFMPDYGGGAFLECDCGASMTGKDEADVRAKWSGARRREEEAK